jgi:hypothetical protein
MAGYTYLWEFRVPEARRSEFERHYGPDGTWATFFRQSPAALSKRTSLWSIASWMNAVQH